MPDHRSDGRPPGVLLVTDNEWLALALSAAAPGWGVTLHQAGTPSQALHVADAINPDVVFVDLWMDRAADRPPVAVALRQAGVIGPVTAIVGLSENALSHSERLAALAAGVWDVVELPADAPALRLRLATWITAKRHADRLEAAAALDEEAPMYTLRGLLARAREFGADAARAGAPLCCVALQLVRGSSGPTEAPLRSDAGRAAGRRVAAAWTTSGRASDVIGHVGRDRFAILAPRTGVEGGRVLAARLVRALEAAEGGDACTSVLALEPASAGASDAVALIGRALEVLRAAARARVLAAS